MSTNRGIQTGYWPLFDLNAFLAGPDAGTKYRPFQRVYGNHNFSDAVRYYSALAQRYIHCHSDLIYHAVLAAEQERDVTGIYEDWPLILTREQALLASSDYEMPYPMDAVTGGPAVLRTSFLVVHSYGSSCFVDARSVAYRKTGTDASPMEDVPNAFLCAYWRAQGVPWRLVTQEELSPAYVQNELYFAACRRKLAFRLISPAQCRAMADLLRTAIASHTPMHLNAVQRYVETAVSCPVTSSELALVSLIDDGSIVLRDMQQVFCAEKPCCVLFE